MTGGTCCVWQAPANGVPSAGMERLETDRVRRRYASSLQEILILGPAALLRHCWLFCVLRRSGHASRSNYSRRPRGSAKFSGIGRVRRCLCSCGRDVESAICERGPLRLKSVVLTSGIIVYQVVSRWTFQEASSDRRRCDLHQLYHTSG